MQKITIIMPVYNKEKYLKNTIDSILKQEYKNFELIIVDDGSTDKSKYICDEYASKDSRIKVYHIQNGGVSNARNIGLKYATGDYIQFIDADDTINTNTFSKYIDILNNKLYDVIFSSYNKVNHDQEILENIKLDYIGNTTKDDILSDFAKNQFNTGYYGWISNKLIKSDIIKENKLKFDKNIVLAEDLDFFVKVYSCASTFYFLNYNTFNYLQEAENSSFFQKKIDYYMQLIIHLRIKEFLELNNKFINENKSILEQRIRDYVFYIVFYEDLNISKIENEVNRVYENKTITKNITLNYVPTFKNIIVFLVTKNKFREIYRLLLMRNKARKIAKGIMGE